MAKRHADWRKHVVMDLNVSGMAEALAELERRDRNVAKKAIARAVSVGGRLVRNASKSTVNVDSRTLLRSLGVREKTYRRVVNGDVRAQRVAIVGPRVNGTRYWAYVRRTKGKRFPVMTLEKPEKISQLVSGGVRPHLIVTGWNPRSVAGGFFINKTKSMIPHPGFMGSKFMEKAAAQAGPAVEQKMLSIIGDAIEGANTAAAPAADAG